MIFFPAAEPTGVTHERVGCPSISTVQAPHWPSPHPYLLPVRSRSSRRTERRLRLESVSSLRATLFMLSSSADIGWLRLLSFVIESGSTERKRSRASVPFCSERQIINRLAQLFDGR